MKKKDKKERVIPVDFVEETKEELEDAEETEENVEVVEEENEENNEEEKGKEQKEKAETEEEPVEAEVTEVEKEAKGEMVSKEQYLRLLAEFTNFKKRSAKEKEELLNLARAGIIQNLLPVVDDFERLMQHIDRDNKDSVTEGVEKIHRKMLTAFESEGLKRIDSENEPFDPNYHEAMMAQPVEDEEKDEVVLQVYEEGYMLNDRLLRPAKVIVGKFMD